MNIDPTLLGVIIGSGVALLGNVINNYYQFKREQKQWENEHSAESTKWLRTEHKKEKEYLRDMYQNGLHSLSVFISIEELNDGETMNADALKLIDNIHKWATMLLLRHSNSSLEEVLNRFTNWPDQSTAQKLRTEIVGLLETEDGFFLNKLDYINEKIIEPDTDADIRKIKINIESEFRKQELIKGIEIPQTFEFTYNFSKMTDDQRQKLTDIYFQSYGKIPSNFNLSVPVHHLNHRTILFNFSWKARLNPMITESEQILTAWEQDYANQLVVAENSLAKYLDQAK